MGVELNDESIFVVFWVNVSLSEEVLAAALVFCLIVASQRDLSQGMEVLDHVRDVLGED